MGLEKYLGGSGGSEGAGTVGGFGACEWWW